MKYPVNPHFSTAWEKEEYDRDQAKLKLVSIPKEWLARAFSLLNEMGGEGIEIEGEADPCRLVADMIEFFQVTESNMPATDILNMLKAT